MKGAYPSLRQAVIAGVWPSLAQSRGKVMFLLDDSPGNAVLYAGSGQTLEGRPLFIATDENSPLASFISIADPVKDQARIAGDVAQGFIVKTYADEETREARAGNAARRDAAFASGAQFVMTDFLLPDKKIGDYQVKLDGRPNATLNRRARYASEQCTDDGGGRRLGVFAFHLACQGPPRRDIPMVRRKRRR